MNMFSLMKGVLLIGKFTIWHTQINLEGIYFLLESDQKA